jgi:hypothetical protein
MWKKRIWLGYVTIIKKIIRRLIAGLKDLRKTIKNKADIYLGK